ncbi:angiopoietin-related protein 7-like [Mytilus trossulus]|uniref:angiopoietin-related protein 7-like n=1 Tax=Mytilus trossulus TaxID=6551 RepID=UPI0030049440
MKDHTPVFIMFCFVVFMMPSIISATLYNNSVGSSVRMPLVSNELKAPLVADLDVSALNTQLKDYIDDNIVSTFTDKMEDMVNKKLLELKNGMLNEYSSKLEKSHTRCDRKLAEMHLEYDNRFSDLSENQSENVTKFMENVQGWQNTLMQSMNEYSSKLEESHTRYEQKLAELYSEYDHRFSDLSENQSENVTKFMENVQAWQNTMIQSMNEQGGYLQKSKIEYENQVSEILGNYRDQTSHITKGAIKNFTDLKTDMEEWKTDMVADLIKAVTMNLTQFETHINNVIRECSDNSKLVGVYRISPDDSHVFNVSCEAGGWTVIQKRFNGVTEFYRNWQDYEDGFGDLNEEFWLGNKYIAMLTSQGNHELRIDLEDWNGLQRYALFESFKVGDQSTNYKLTVSGYSGNAGDSMTYHNNMPFSTYDRDNDRSSLNCAAHNTLKGAWWFNACWRSSLNGKYSKTMSAGDGMAYHNNMPFSTYDRDNDARHGFNCAAAKDLKGAWWYNGCYSSSLNGKYTNEYHSGGIKYLTWGLSQTLKESSMMIRRI